MRKPTPKIAVVHDYFTQMGGAEQVAAELFNLVPDADVFTTVALPDMLPAALREVKVKTSWMQRLPRMSQYYREYFLLYPFGVESLDLSAYDLVLSSSSGYGKGVRTRRDAVHVCYCHTPMRWAWYSYQYAERDLISAPRRAILNALTNELRRWDLGASRQPDHFIANSRNVAERILHIYGRHAEVIPPPIDVNRFRPSYETEDYFLVLARLVSYKRIDLAIEACNRLSKRLVVIGDGPDMQRLESFAGPTIRFCGRLPNPEVDYYASRCRALIFPGEEDFGMVPLEVAAAGRPTIAYRAGGAVETIVNGETGLFFDRPDVEALMEAMERFEGAVWSHARLRRHAEMFSIDAFQYRLRKFLMKVGAPIGEPARVTNSAWQEEKVLLWEIQEPAAS